MADLFALSFLSLFSLCSTPSVSSSSTLSPPPSNLNTSTSPHLTPPLASSLAHHPTLPLSIPLLHPFPSQSRHPCTSARYPPPIEAKARGAHQRHPGVATSRTLNGHLPGRLGERWEETMRYDGLSETTQTRRNEKGEQERSGLRLSSPREPSELACRVAWTNQEDSQGAARPVDHAGDTRLRMRRRDAVPAEAVGRARKSETSRRLLPRVPHPLLPPESPASSKKRKKDRPQDRSRPNGPTVRPSKQQADMQRERELAPLLLTMTLSRSPSFPGR